MTRARGARLAPPGRASQLADLLRAVERLELRARHNAGGLTRGDYRTAVRGQGLLFRETRKYVAGEPVRRIDWNITARLGEPYVRVHEEERRRDVVVALDLSPSMHGGLGEKTKLEHGVELASTLAASAIEGGDRLGHVLFSDRLIDDSWPRGGRRQLLRVLRSILEEVTSEDALPARGAAESDLRVAVDAVERRRRGRRVIFLISDFVDRDLPEDLRFLRRHHDVSLLHVYDPLEYAAASPAVLFPAFAYEGRDRRARIRPGDTGGLAAAREQLRRRAARLGIACGDFPTDQPVSTGLRRLFAGRR